MGLPTQIGNPKRALTKINFHSELSFACNELIIRVSCSEYIAVQHELLDVESASFTTSPQLVRGGDTLIKTGGSISSRPGTHEDPSFMESCKCFLFDAICQQESQGRYY